MNKTSSSNGIGKSQESDNKSVLLKFLSTICAKFINSRALKKKKFYSKRSPNFCNTHFLRIRNDIYIFFSFNERFYPYSNRTSNIFPHYVHIFVFFFFYIFTMNTENCRYRIVHARIEWTSEQTKSSLALLNFSTDERESVNPESPQFIFHVDISRESLCLYSSSPQLDSFMNSLSIECRCLVRRVSFEMRLFFSLSLSLSLHSR